MGAIFNRDDAPSHLFSIPELDFSEDLFAERLSGPWFRLGALTIKPHSDERGIEDVVRRQSLLLAPEAFAAIFDKLKHHCHLSRFVGRPGGCVHEAVKEKDYTYVPFYRFEFGAASVVGEPLVFVHSATSGTQLLINPDLWLFLELEEKTYDYGIWWDPRRGVEALRKRVVGQGNIAVVEIQIDYLLRYLQARQMSLVVGHYRHLHLFDPPDSTIQTFVTGDLILESPDQDAKANLQNWGLRRIIPGKLFLQRRLHLWFEIKPPKIDVDDPWVEEPSFDPYTFTLPTRVGQVAPARWTHFGQIEGRSFTGQVCNFMDLVFFRQEVLTKYEARSGFDVRDDGSVSCYHYWGLVRSTERIGNEFLVSAIGDFAEGVPFEEWPHWQQYAVEPPSPETIDALGQEQTVADAVNSLFKALCALNEAFARMAASFGLTIAEPVWSGSLDSLAGRQLKWVYPANAEDDEFLKRATLASTLVIDELKSKPLRDVLSAVDQNLHRKDKTERQSLGSLNLVQRLTLIALLIEDLRPDITEIPILVRRAEGKPDSTDDPELQAELESARQRIRDEFAPMAMLYELRKHGGLAHTLNKPKMADAVRQLGLPVNNWHRADYLRLLNLVAASICEISEHFESAAQVAALCGFPEPG